jgi:hypothetical protein
VYEEGANVTRSLARRANANKAENVRDNVSKQVLLLITRLEKDLRDQVFSQSDKEMIEDTRLITDLKTTAVRIKLRGAILISNIERAKYSITTLRKIIPSVNEAGCGRDHNSSIRGISGTAGASGQKQKE